MGIKITIDGDGEIIIKKRKKKKKPKSPEVKPPVIQPVILEPVIVRPKPGIVPSAPHLPDSPLLKVDKSLIDVMEIRVESVFRPNSEDVETAYGLSGDEVLDMLHKFTSNEVITEATPSVIYTVTNKKLEHILREREEKPKIIVDVHTHPGGIPEPSETDRNTWLKVAEVFKEGIPGVEVYFGVHAFSNELPTGRRETPVVNGNKIKWKSLNRWHEVAFFDEYSNPKRVELWE